MEINYRRIAWIWQNTPERFLQLVFDVYSNVSIQSSILTPTRIEDETRDPAGEN